MKRFVTLILIGKVLLLGVGIYFETPVEIKYVHAATPVEEIVVEVEEPKEVLIRVEIDWSEERVVKEIRDTFTETPNTMVAIFKCENGWSEQRGWDVDIVGPTSDYGITQIHEPTWHDVAIELGYENYKTDPYDNIQMAYYIYGVQGPTAWVCYKNGWWKNYL